jgi:hypothetical protein
VGVKTPEGKAAARLNAVKHGLFSEQLLLLGEDEEALRELSEHLRAELRPVGYLENLLVKRIIAACWRPRRLGGVEAGIFAWELYGELAERAQQEARTHEKSDLDQLLEDTGSPPTILDERKHQEALSEAKEMEAKREAETATLSRTLIRDADKANAFSELSSYETMIEWSLRKALHELQRLQAGPPRRGQRPPARSR